MNAIELPFLYQTRTILQCAPRAGARRSVRHRPSSRRCLYATAANPPEDSFESFLSRKAREATGNTLPRNKASITRTEKQIFDGIFKDIKHSAGLVAAPKHNIDETDPTAILRLFIHESGQRPDPLATTSQHTGGGQKRRRPNASFHELIKRYPSALRYKALQVTARQSVPPDWPENLPYQSFQPIGPAESSPIYGSTSKDPRHGVYRPLSAPPESAVEAPHQSGPQIRDFDAIKEDEIARGTFRGKIADFVESELKNIAAEMQECTSTSSKSQSGAFKIWNICQSRIFPIIKLLDEPGAQIHATPPDEVTASLQSKSTPTPANPVKTAKKASKKGILPSQTAKESPSNLTKLTAPSLPAGVSPILTTTTLYPALTLLTLRLLTSSFPTTPFPLTLYTTLKSLSPQSRILALNVHFYNTLLTHTWTIYSSLQEITALLAEMQTSGIDFNGDTYNLIRSIEEERWTQFNTGDGDRGKEWWLRAEQVRRFGGLMEWKQIVAVRLQEQGMGHLLAEREYSSDLQAMRERVAEEPRVWL